MFIALEIIGILFMLTFILIGIWSFIILNKVYGQLKYKNYLIEKINHNLTIKNNCNNLTPAGSKSDAIDNETLDNSGEIPLEKDSSKESTINAYDSETLSPDKKEV